MSYVKNYDVGQINVDLLNTVGFDEPPYVQYTHELPLLSFGDVQHNLSLSLVFNYERYRDEKANNKNPFFIAPGFKLNLHKRLIINQYDLLTAFQGEDGRNIDVMSFGNKFTFDDESQRIIRRTAHVQKPIGGNTLPEDDLTTYTYAVEHSDFSKEDYNESGRITNAYDKYGNVVLSYAYNTSGQLESVTFRGSKIVTLGYASNLLSSIMYNGKTTTFHYKSDGMLNYVQHYTGVKYTFTLSKPSFSAYDVNFECKASATENNATVSYSKKLELAGNDSRYVYNINISDTIQNDVVNTVTYRFPETIACLGTKPPFKYVDIIDNNGVETRVQLYNNKAVCSYEITNGSPDFSENADSPAASKFLGNVSLLNTTNDSFHYCVGDVQSANDGRAITYNEDQEWHYWYKYTPNNLVKKGYYTVSGWLKTSDNTNHKKFYYGPGNAADDDMSFEVHFGATGQWQYFSTVICLTTSNLCIRTDMLDSVSVSDIKISFQEIGETMGSDSFSTNITEYVLIKNNSIVPFSEAKFVCTVNSENIEIDNGSEETAITFFDVMRYKTRYIKNGLSNELYYNNVNGVMTGVTAYQVLVNGSYYAINDVDLGIRTYSKDKITFTKIETSTDDPDCFVKTVTVTKKTKIDTYDLSGEGVIETSIASTEVLNENLDVLQSTVDGITTSYARDAQGRLTEESVAGLYKQVTTYSDTLITVKNVNPSTDATINAIKYYINSIWGVVSKTELLDANDRVESVTIDTHDDAMSTLLTRSFDNMLIRRNEFQYAKGRLSSVTGGTLQYGFEYADATGDLASVSKNNVTVEEHSQSKTDGGSTVESAYPSSEEALHTEKKVFDRRGRLQSIDGVLENQYCITPHWSYHHNNMIKHTMEDYDKSIHGELNHICPEINDIEDVSKYEALSQSTDLLVLEKTKYGYDKGLLTAAVTYTLGDLFLRQETFVYDKVGRLIKDRFDYNSTGTGYVTGEIEYERAQTHPLADSRVKNYTYFVNGVETAKTLNYYDNYKRVSCKQHTISGKTFTKSIGYLGDKISIVSDTTVGNTTTYQYDDFGRITSTSTNGTTITYKYNSYGQLIRENNQVLDKTFVYRYNNNGGVTKVKEYEYADGTPTSTAVETAFTYDSTHPDRLTSYGGTSISYNAMGCPTTVNGYTASWARGKLAKLTKGLKLTGTDTYNYSYNAFGQRVGSSYAYTAGTTSGSVSLGMLTGYTKTFRYDQSGRLICESKTSQYYGELDSSEHIVYLYDGSSIIGMQYSGSSAAGTYYFQRNLLGDVIGIYDTRGKKVAGYAYDAWGKCTITSDTEIYDVAHANPIRYRGYYYDEDTGLYYLNARYYNPAWRRFISPDDTAYLDPDTPNGLNLYTYCNNDPINYADPSGHFAFWIAAGLAIGTIGLISGGIYAGIKSSQAGNTGWDLFCDIALGAAIGGILGFAIGALMGAGISGFLTGYFLSSVKDVIAGAVLMHQMFRVGSIATVGYMILDNLSNAFKSPLHVFWSGGDIAKNQAMAYANQNGGITLEMTRLGKYLETLPYNRQLWEYASRNFANQVSNNGVVRAILYYPQMNENAIWFTEKEILIKKLVEIIIGSLQ